MFEIKEVSKVEATAGFWAAFGLAGGAAGAGFWLLGAALAC